VKVPATQQPVVRTKAKQGSTASKGVVIEVVRTKAKQGSTASKGVVIEVRGVER
jgi:hypothetical protein